MDRPSTSRGVSLNDRDYIRRIDRMLNDEELSEYEDSGEDVDDSDADPDYVLPQNHDVSDSDTTDLDDGDALLQNEGEIVLVDTSLPEYVFGRLKKDEFGPGYPWCTRCSTNTRVRTPAHNIIRGGLPGLTAESRRLGKTILR